MTNDQIIDTLLNLLRNGTETERELALKAVCALTVALETIPSEELRIELAKAAKDFFFSGRNDLTNRAEVALKYPSHQRKHNRSLNSGTTN